MFQLIYDLRASYWFVPSIMALLAIVLGAVMVWLDAGCSRSRSCKVRRSKMCAIISSDRGMPSLVRQKEAVKSGTFACLTRRLVMPRNKFLLSLIPLMLAAGTSGAAAQSASSLSVPGLSGQQFFTGARDRKVLTVQVLLDHSGHSPGVVDGVMGGNTVRAIKAFQRAQGMDADGKLSEALLQKLQTAHSGELLQPYTIATEDVSGPFVPVPSDMEGQAQLDTLGYESPAEALAEKFHMAQSLLKTLNPGADFSSPGTQITVIVPGETKLDAKVTRVEVDKAASAVRAFAANGTLVATYPATIGSSTFPSPDGTMEVIAVAAEPTYHFEPEGRDWGPDKKLTIAAGPNNPVGGTWIDLSKEGYGIHGTPDPNLIGKTSSHGCVRLTNWDAEELANAVSKGTAVEFV